MAEQLKSDAAPPRRAEGEDLKDAPDELAAPRGRAEYVIAFGVVALVSMIFGFLIGLMF